jgi:hypothetical protein
MTRYAPLVAALMIAASPALAQDAPTPTPPANPELSEGAQKLSEGMKLLLRGLLAEGEEGWANLLTWLDDLSQYEAPEQLPNGDIIIRRKTPVEPGQTDL